MTTINLNRKSIDINQDNIKIVVTNLNVAELIKNTYADVFASKNNPEGYQRPLNTIQINRIYEYIKTANNQILPTSIILAIHKDNIDNKSEGIIKLKGKFRIIDGQHRIAAMKKYIKEYELNEDKTEEEIYQYEEFKKWEFPVNIMLLDKNNTHDKYIEIRSFVDINKKGKKVSTDLANSTLKNIRENFKLLPQKYAIYQICILVTAELIDNKSSVWFEGIGKGDQSTYNRLIGISSFKLSIISIVGKFLYELYTKKDDYSTSEINDTAKRLTEIFMNYWNAIGDKWEDAFYWDSDLNAYRVDPDYNIQKSLGVSSLHKVLNHFYDKETTFEDALSKSINSLKSTNITSDAWIVGGEFSSYTSGSGHNKIKNILISG
jgi:DGQHR domain-containing protein